MKFLKYMSLAGAMALSTQAHSAVVEGQTDFIVNDDSSITMIFDLVTSDIEGEGDGLLFSIDFFEVLVTGSDIVIQDEPSDGGLGIEPDPDGDNIAGGESMTFAFNDPITLISIAFNGLQSGDGHEEMADGMVSVNGNSLDAAAYSLTGQGTLPDSGLISSFDVVADADFTGYVESITFFIGEPPLGVPEPGTLLLLASGLFGCRFLKRRS
ncbi:PEP-CTERM sorting domain-containing protein [Thalassotalea litorea]|uniref:PEP-CTERM sorting domain-containing protein n=1 Tax=Thalassotalea litorea TaxID=2020715 RepID=A0A5R9II38_9GAMM|nr:PEP-CTERM sorting domain-containing protein [Thalassotalea litorea]TLU61012.1 PEP-CTERM sorting domain-containing protein [Thalassotalea litorea]